MGRAGFKFSMRDTDRGWKKLKASARRIGQGKPFVKVGIVGPRAMQTHGQFNLTTVSLAMIHEFGAVGAYYTIIPERSFIRSTFDKNRVAYRAMLKKLLWNVFSTKPLRTEEQALGILGAKIAADMKGTITEGAGIPPPLAKSTVERKGSERPLIDTGQLVNSISWELSTKGRR